MSVKQKYRRGEEATDRELARVRRSPWSFAIVIFLVLAWTVAVAVVVQSFCG